MTSIITLISFKSFLYSNWKKFQNTSSSQMTSKPCQEIIVKEPKTKHFDQASTGNQFRRWYLIRFPLTKWITMLRPLVSKYCSGGDRHLYGNPLIKRHSFLSEELFFKEFKCIMLYRIPSKSIQAKHFTSKIGLFYQDYFV